MEISPSLDSTPATRTPTDRPSGGGTVLSSDFETFLIMLTTQLQNQDPLNPLQSSDFAVQLATFSGVEQQVKTNDLLSSLATSLASSSMAQMATWIGKEVRTDGPAYFDGAPITLYPDREPGTDQSFLVVKDAAGRTVARESLGTGNPVTWAGVDANGGPLSPGLYSFEVENSASGAVTSIPAVEHYARVEEVRNAPDGPLLSLLGGFQISSSEVLSVREPSAE